MGMVPPFLNGLAVFADKHALALAHASEGGKCRVWEKWPTGQPQAGGSEYLELHGAFSIALRAPGAALLSRFGFLAGREAQEIAFAVVFALSGGALRGGWTSPLRFSLAFQAFSLGVSRGDISFAQTQQTRPHSKLCTEIANGHLLVLLGVWNRSLLLCTRSRIGPRTGQLFGTQSLSWGRCSLLGGPVNTQLSGRQ
jgi:hypothetical protein